VSRLHLRDLRSAIFELLACTSLLLAITLSIFFDCYK
jgi:hypothetical protein